MINYRWIQGTDFYMEYCIPQGEALKEHSHDAETLHDVMVVQGAVEIKCSTGVISASAGQGPVSFDGTQPHTITALVDSVILNKFLNGMPESYKALPDSEHTGTIP